MSNDESAQDAQSEESVEDEGSRAPRFQIQNAVERKETFPSPFELLEMERAEELMRRREGRGEQSGGDAE